MKSIWKNTGEHKNYPSINQNMKTDTLIIGGGMAGLLCGYLLHQQGERYLVAEKGRIASGVTGNTTAKITAHHGLIYSKMMKKEGAEVAGKYLDINQKAISQYEKIAREIPCDFQRKDNFVYTQTDSSKILEEAEALEKLGVKAEYMPVNNLPIKTEAAVKVPNQAQFNPIEFVQGISENMNILEHSFVRSIDKEGSGYVATLENEDGQLHKIIAGKIIMATHFPYLDKHGFYFLKMYQHRSYAVAIDNRKDIGGMYIGDKEESLSFRNCKNYLLIAGCGGRTGTTCGGLEQLKNFVKENYPQNEIVAHWATQDCITLDGIPYIGQYSKSLENFYVATGFNKWGMTSSMVAAMILTGQADSETAEIFKPNRSILKPQLLVNGFEATKNMLTPTKPRCSHLKCALKWNKAEHSWDCPCHGSRFDEEGRVLENPAQHKIT